MRAVSMTILLAMWACGGNDDGDGDGFAGDLDCNDSDPLVFPDAEEVCDGVDNDCNGQVDEDLGSTFYLDSDGDGYGTGGGTRECDPGANLATEGGDCDDARADVNPAAAEDCDETVDKNCDTDPTLGAADLKTWYLDADLDTYGDPATGEESCTEIPGKIADGTDCNDTSNVSYPGAEEICDGLDNDCDKSVDEDATDALTWYQDTDLDLHGDPDNSQLACESPKGSWVSDLGDDCDDTNAEAYPGHNEFCDGGVDNDCDPSTNEATTAIWYQDLDGDAYGNTAVTYTGCSPPGGYVQVSGDCDDTLADINPVTFPGCEWDHCALSTHITTSEVWRNTLVHKVSCDLQVDGASGPVLTIEDGTRVEFGALGALTVGVFGRGGLVVEGTDLGVVLTSEEKVPAPGDWGSVRLGTELTTTSRLEGLTVEYGTGVWVQSDIELDGVTLSRNLGDGLRISGNGVEPYVHDSEITENTGNGITIEIGAGLLRNRTALDGGPTFTDNLVIDNGGRPISLPGSHADELDPSSTLTPNDFDQIELLGGTLRFTGTWYDHGIPYVVRENSTISIEDGPQAELTLEDGVTVKFDQDSALWVGVTAEGSLLVEDGPTGVVLTATDEVIALSNNWDGVRIGDYGGNTVLTNTLIEYGGANAYGNVWIEDSAPMLDGVLSRYSDWNGIYVTGLLAAPTIQNCVIVDNDENGVEVTSTSGLARSASGPTFVNNELRNNGQAPVLLPANFVGELDPSTTFTGNGARIKILSGTVSEDALWRKLDETYEVLGTVNIGGPQNPIVEIEAGTDLYMAANVKFRAGLNDDGALIIDAATDPVLMTSANAVPGPGDWHGVELGRNEGASTFQSAINGLRLEYAGGNDAVPDEGVGALSLMDRSDCDTPEPEILLSNIEIDRTSKAGLAMAQSTHASIDGLDITNAGEMCVAIGGLSPSIACYGTQVPMFEGFTCTNSPEFGAFPIKLIDNVFEPGDPAGLPLLTTAIAYPGPIRIRDRQVIDDVVLADLGVPYIFQNDFTVANVSDPALIIRDDVELRFEPDAGLNIASPSSNGSIHTGQNVLFTSSQDVKQPGDWRGITFNRYCGNELPPLNLYGVELSDSTIEYAGGNGSGALYFNTCDVVDEVVNNLIQYSSGCGIYVRPAGAPFPTGNTFQFNSGLNFCSP